MIRRLALPLSIVLCLLMGTPLLSETLSDPCATDRVAWSNAYEALQAAMEGYRRIKNESVGPLIAREMDAHDRGLSIARVVEVVLKERGKKLSELGRQCLELANVELSFFEHWRRCASAGVQKRDSASVAAFKKISRDRDRLMAELRDLLLDEAYVQYKNHRAPAAPASPSYEANGPSSTGLGYR
jgi:hypothetical protein